MFNLELLLRNSMSVLVVHRKSEEDANGLYEQIANAVASEKQQLLKLSCERQPKKKIAILSSEIAAVQLTES